MTSGIRPWFGPNHERFATRRALVALVGFIAALAALMLAVGLTERSNEGLYVVRAEVALAPFWAWLSAYVLLAVGSLFAATHSYVELKDEWQDYRAEWLAAKTGMTRLLFAALLTLLTFASTMLAMWIGFMQGRIVPSRGWQFLTGLTVGEWVLGGIGVLMLLLAYRYISWRWPGAFADLNELD